MQSWYFNSIGLKPLSLPAFIAERQHCAFDTSKSSAPIDTIILLGQSGPKLSFLNVGPASLEIDELPPVEVNVYTP
jgi:hypothetical protein